MRIEAEFTGTSTAKQNVTLCASVELGSTGWLVTSRASGHDKIQRTRVGTNDCKGLRAVAAAEESSASRASGLRLRSWPRGVLAVPALREAGIGGVRAGPGQHRGQSAGVGGPRRIGRTG